MEHEKLVALVEQLLVEVTVQRLVTRSVLINLIVKSGSPIADLLDALDEEAVMTSPDVFPLPGVDADLQRRASGIAVERAQILLRTFGRGLRGRPASHRPLSKIIDAPEFGSGFGHGMGPDVPQPEITQLTRR